MNIPDSWTLDAVIKAFVLRKLKAHGTITATARALGWHRRTLQRWLDKHGGKPTTEST